MSGTGEEDRLHHGAGDEVPRALENLGCEVVELSDAAFENGDLSPFEAVVTGVRAYNTRDVLKKLNGKLLRYVENADAGRPIQRGLDSAQRADRALSVDRRRDRVSVENAPVVLSFARPPPPQSA